MLWARNVLCCNKHMHKLQCLDVLDSLGGDHVVCLHELCLRSVLGSWSDELLRLRGGNVLLVFVLVRELRCRKLRFIHR